jgi:hypothetical protein
VSLSRVGVAADCLRASEGPAGQYKGLKLDCGYRIDLLLPGCVVVTVKAVEVLQPLHEARLLREIGAWKLELQINFKVPVVKNGIGRKILGVTLWARWMSAVNNYVTHGPYASRRLLVARMREEQDTCRQSDYPGTSGAFRAVSSMGSGPKLLKQPRPWREPHFFHPAAQKWG